MTVPVWSESGSVKPRTQITRSPGENLAIGLLPNVRGFISTTWTLLGGATSGTTIAGVVLRVGGLTVVVLSNVATSAEGPRGIGVDLATILRDLVPTVPRLDFAKGILGK